MLDDSFTVLRLRRVLSRAVFRRDQSTKYLLFGGIRS